jgi:hypothetical protein
MDVKLCCDLFNTLVHCIASYAYEVWVDSEKIEAIEVVYRRFLKSLLGVRKTTNMSIVLVKFGKFPFEHFTWGQALYYNRVSTVTKDRILGKTWERHGKPNSEGLSHKFLGPYAGPFKVFRHL